MENFVNFVEVSSLHEGGAHCFAHRRRLHGGDGGDRPHSQKVVGAMPSSRPHRNFAVPFFSYNKMGQVLGVWFNPSRGCTGNYKHVTRKWQKEP